MKTTTFRKLVTNASVSSFAGPMAVFKGSGEVVYTPEINLNCFEEYYQPDVRLFINVVKGSGKEDADGAENEVKTIFRTTSARAEERFPGEWKLYCI